MKSHAQTLTTQDKLLNLWSQNLAMPEAWQESLHAYAYKVMVKAQPDECYYGLGDALNRPSFEDHYPNWLSKDDLKACVNTWVTDHFARPKTNQSYIWGLTKSGNNLWLGTAANNICRGPVTLFGSPLPAYETDSWVCEESGKDARPPRMFMYDTLKSKLIDLTPQILAKGEDSPDVLRLRQTVGIRSAGAFGGVVFFGGVSVAVPQGEPWDIYTVVLFAFNASTKAYLGSYIYDGSDAAHPYYANVRQWVVAGGDQPSQKHLYVGVGTTVNPYLGFTGKVMRWTGSVADPFQFESVGDLNADPAYLIQYKDRLVSSTWGGDALGGFVIYMSPPFGDDKMLTTDDKDLWAIKWTVSQYEPEAAAVESGGAIGVEGDALIWGTLQAPTTGWMAYMYMYPSAPNDATGLLNAFFGTIRPISIFRGYNMEAESPGDRQVQLLYGSQYLPKFDPIANEWNIVPNMMAPRRPGAADGPDRHGQLLQHLHMVDGELPRQAVRRDVRLPVRRSPNHRRHRPSAGNAASGISEGHHEAGQAIRGRRPVDVRRR